jgi:hypothetical protein
VEQGDASSVHAQRQLDSSPSSPSENSDRAEVEIAIIVAIRKVKKFNNKRC